MASAASTNTDCTPKCLSECAADGRPLEWCLDICCGGGPIPRQPPSPATASSMASAASTNTDCTTKCLSQCGADGRPLEWCLDFCCGGGPIPRQPPSPATASSMASAASTSTDCTPRVCRNVMRMAGP